MSKFEVNAILAVAGGIIASLLGGWDRAITVLSILMVVDYLTGCAAAFKAKTISSSIGFMGLTKKATIFLVIIVATQLDAIMNDSGFARTSTIIFFASNEGISILENVNGVGVRLPKFLKDTLIKLRDDHEDVDANTKETTK